MMTSARFLLASLLLTLALPGCGADSSSPSSTGSPEGGGGADNSAGGAAQGGAQQSASLGGASAAGGATTSQGGSGNSCDSCAKWTCTCNDSNMKIAGKSCDNGVCADGDTYCGSVCQDHGGVAGFVIGDTTSGAGGSSSMPSKCLSDGSACGECEATNCCAEGAACANDSACQSGAVCLILTCKGDFATCAKQCDTANNPAFEAYTACLTASSCGPLCKK